MNLCLTLCRRTRGVAIALASTLVTSTVLADVEQCIEAHSQGQVLRDDNRLIEAHSMFLSCARDESCPVPIKEECEQYLTGITQMIPTVVFAARDGNGQDIDGVRVEVDGEFLTDVGDTTPLPMNPGEYQVRFEDSEGRVVNVKLLTVPGEKARLVSALFETQTPRTEPALDASRAERPTNDVRRISTYVFGGLTVVGLTGFTVFGLQGKSMEDELRSSCAPNCTGAQKHSVAQKYLLADISLAVLGLSVAGGAVLYLTPPPAGSDGVASVGLRGTF